MQGMPALNSTMLAASRAEENWRALQPCRCPIASGVMIVLAVLLMSGPIAPEAQAQPSVAEDQRVEFDIPAQPLLGALDVFATQAGVQILFPYDMAQTQTSLAVRGRMASGTALRQLLGQSELEPVNWRNGTVTLRRRPPAAQQAPENAGQRVVRHPRPTLPEAAAPEMRTLETIIVTGRAGAANLTQQDASYAVTVLDWDMINRTAPASTADLFTLIPGFWVESSGGEAANNVRMRGIPTDGFSSIALLENGIPVQYDGNLGYLNTDQSFRLDETIARVEAVRGGPSTIFAPNSPGGTVNFLTRRGVDPPQTVLKYTLGDYAHHRIDMVATRQLSDTSGLLLGGFFRRDNGMRNPGFTANEGGQIRLRHDFDDGHNRFFFDLRHLDDRVAFYLPVPLTQGAEGEIYGVPGFDPLKDTLAGPDTEALKILTGDGPLNFDLSEGTHTKLTAVTLGAEIELRPDWTVMGAMRIRNSNTLRNALFPVSAPEALGDYLAAHEAELLEAFSGGQALEVSYAADGAPLAGDAAAAGALVLEAELRSARVPLDEAILDFRLNGAFDLAGRHDMATGISLAAYDLRYDRSGGVVLLRAEDRARRLDVTIHDAGGSQIGALTDNGFLEYGSVFNRAGMQVDALAIYVADEWAIAPKLRLDFASRWERNTIKAQVADAVRVDLGNPSTLADDSVFASTGSEVSRESTFYAFGWSLGANYAASRHLGVHARYTDTFRMPSASEFTSVERSDQGVVPITMAEVGGKFATRTVELQATGFYTRYERLPFLDYRYDEVSKTYQPVTAIAETRTHGLEVEARLAPVDGFDLAFGATLQDGQYHDFAFSTLVNGVPVSYDYTGNKLIRVPRAAFRLTPALTVLDGKLRTELEISRYSDRYANSSNTRVLPAYTLADLNVSFRLSDQATIKAHVRNLTNELGLTEGNPRAGFYAIEDPGTDYFLARPEFGRTARLSLRFEF